MHYAHLSTGLEKNLVHDRYLSCDTRVYYVLRSSDLAKRKQNIINTSLIKFQLVIIM